MPRTHSDARVTIPTRRPDATLVALVAATVALAACAIPRSAPPPLSTAPHAGPASPTGVAATAARGGVDSTLLGDRPPVLRAGQPRATGAADTLDRSRPPALGPVPELRLPPIAERTLGNGLRVVVVAHHELPVADVVLVVRTGGEADPAGRPGLATLTADLLDEGAGGRSALAIADQAAFLGLRLETGASWDASVVSLHTPTAQLDSALALFADVVARPTFPAREVDRLKRERLTGLLQLQDDPPAVANRAFAGLLFGDAHPYGRPLGGTAAATRAIARADVERFWRTHWRPGNATLLVVGDVAPDDVVARLERVLGPDRWPAGSAPAPVVPAAPAAPARTTIHVVDRPGAPQTSVRIGTVGVARATADDVPLRVLNTILGGSFTSRLNQNLRETHGWTYGAGSAFDMRRGVGPFVADAEVTGEKTDSALVEVLRELRAIRDTVPAEELARAKRYIQLRLPAAFETTEGIANQLVPLVVHGLPLDWHASLVQRVEQVTQADVQRVAERYLDPDRLLVVLVGDRQRIEPAVRALNVGPVTVRTIPDVLGGAPRR